ncbi:hypothetical protein ACSBR1_027526 [Camellia fascicularis]
MAMEFGVGYKFNASDIELIEYYLLNKIINQPLPVQGHLKKKKSRKGKRIDQTVGKMGTWKAIDGVKPIEDHHGRVIRGKRSLDYENKERSGEHGAWNMKEYNLDGASLTRINDLKVSL